MGHSDFDSGPCLLHASKIIACQRLVESGADVNAASTKSSQPGKRRQALLESNPPRNTQPTTHRDDEPRGGTCVPLRAQAMSR